MTVPPMTLMQRLRTPVEVRHFYRAYGMMISSELELPELEPAEPGVADLSIRVRAVKRPKPGRPGATIFEFDSHSQYLAWESVGAFLITDARQIDVEPAPGVDDRLIAFPLLGPVLALLLHQRGVLVLHASAIAAHGKGVIFLGNKGAGKSTMASAMLAAGHELLTDDLVAISFAAGERPTIAPGFPQLKLAEDAAAVVSVKQADVRTRVHPAIDKLQHRLASGFAVEKVEPARLYVLRRGPEPAVTPLSRQQALSAILQFSYVVRFGRAALSGAAAGDHLKQCASLAERIGVFHLDVPDDLGDIGRSVNLVESDVLSAGRA